MEISVIIPTYKPQNYLYECLRSLNNQTFDKTKYETIVVLNGCCEPYKSQIIRFIREQSTCNIRLIQTESAGVSNARNLGLCEAKGEYFVFVDDDDFVSSCYLEELFNCSDEDTIGLCYPLQFLEGTDDYNPYYITKYYNRLVNVGVVDFYKADGYFGGPVYKMIHRGIINKRTFNTKYQNGEDTLFMFLISDRMKKVSFTSRNAIYYRRIRAESATQSKKKIKAILKNRFCLMQEFTKLYFSDVKNYNFRFYLKFMSGSIKAIIYNVLKNFIKIKPI